LINQEFMNISLFLAVQLVFRPCWPSDICDIYVQYEHNSTRFDEKGLKGRGREIHTVHIHITHGELRNAQREFQNAGRHLYTH
jgi:hypothetical protein